MGLDEGGWSPLHEPRLFRTFPSGGSLGDYLDNLITSIFFFFFKKILRITLKKNAQVQFIFLTARLRVGLQREAIRHRMHEQLIYLIPRYYHWREILAECNTLSWEQNQMRHFFFVLQS